MWLINTETLTLESVVNPESVEYAILSHTWEEEEVSFQEFQNSRLARKRKGFAKIEMTCYLARDQGYRYAWVDACCIDKSSSAELSEAINSMFRWYKGAKVCYAYLSDYDQTKVGRRFGNCRWFSRGWTLQELIAPKFLTFYNRHWTALGSKIELSKRISRITRIDEGVLLGHIDINTIHVVHRMSWAAKRKTSRPEDIAYCLFGIFDVNLPMLYGEGTKAFLRLQEEICQRVHDLTLFAWKTEANQAAEVRGIFARSPDEFAYASSENYNYQLYPGDLRVSNRGIVFDDMELLVVYGQGIFLPLSTFVETPGKVDARGIFLDKTPDGYVRVKTDKLRPTELEGRWLGPEQINVISWGTAAIRQASSMIYVSTLGVVEINNVCPRRQWDPYKQAFIETGQGMVKLNVNPSDGRFYSPLVLFQFSKTDQAARILQHDIIGHELDGWSNVLADIGKVDLCLSSAAGLADHFHRRGQNHRGPGTWVHKIPDTLIDIHVQVEMIQGGWLVRLSCE
jgi:hypothetical protein